MPSVLDTTKHNRVSFCVTQYVVKELKNMVISSVEDCKIQKKSRLFLCNQMTQQEKMADETRASDLICSILLCGIVFPRMKCLKFADAMPRLRTSRDGIIKWHRTIVCGRLPRHLKTTITLLHSRKGII